MSPHYLQIRNLSRSNSTLHGKLKQEYFRNRAEEANNRGYYDKPLWLLSHSFLIPASFVLLIVGLRGIEWVNLGTEGPKNLCIVWRFCITVRGLIWHAS
jgi:hypothetical protein